MSKDDLGNFISDAALRLFATTEGPITYTCAPPGSGIRMGIDRDDDSLTDGVETGTGIFVNASDTGTSAWMADTDGDGFNDDVEVAAGSDPNDPLSTPLIQPEVPALSLIGQLMLTCTMVIGAVVVRRTRSLS